MEGVWGLRLVVGSRSGGAGVGKASRDSLTSRYRFETVSEQEKGRGSQGNCCTKRARWRPEPSPTGGVAAGLLSHEVTGEVSEAAAAGGDGRGIGGRYGQTEGARN